MTSLPFYRSIRARLLLIALLLLTIPLIGFRFIQEMDGYLREGQLQVLSSTAKLLSATLSDRPQLFGSLGKVDNADEADRRHMLALFGSADPEAAADLGSAYLPSDEVERILGVVASTASRIWVVDAHSRVRGLAGALNNARPVAASKPNPETLSKIYASTIRPLVRILGPNSPAAAHDDPREARLAVMSQVDRALVGEPNVRWRDAADGPATVLSVAQPIWQGDNIVGAVVVEETAGSGQSIKSAALESLLATTLVVFAVGFVALLAFAWRLAYRVRRLQTEADEAIDAQGRIRGIISGSSTQDEIGALSKTLGATLERLQQYNNYLEKMAERLSHELRTPVAVVRSSLDNLRHGSISDADRVYIDRADEGVKRLALLISRMSEATQLEHFLQNAEKERFDLVSVVKGCVDSYRMTYPEREFRLSADVSAAVLVTGSADAIAQLLDKLVQNALDFAESGTPIRLGLTSSRYIVQISVENYGPLLPEQMSSHLFVSMVTARAQSGSRAGHLGLGLYIVRLIAEFHGGSVKAENLSTGDGVRFVVSLPIR